MGLFDFLKKKEFDRIKELENRVKELEAKNNSLSKYLPLTDIESQIEKLEQDKIKVVLQKV